MSSRFEKVQHQLAGLRGVFSLAIAFNLISIGIVLYLRPLIPVDPLESRAPIFYYLFARYELWGGLLSLFAIGVSALGLFTNLRLPQIDVEKHYRLILALVITLWSLVALSLCPYVYLKYPLCMDEYTQYFQAELFAKGTWYSPFPKSLAAFLSPFGSSTFLIFDGTSDRVFSQYIPGWSALLAFFAFFRAGWTANIFVSAATLAATAWLMRLLHRSKREALLAVFFLAVSPFFLINAFSFYAMPSHLLFNVLFLCLFIQSGSCQTVGAGLIGSVALNLHNPVPHLLFTAPWSTHLLLSRQWRRAALLFVGYLPGLAFASSWLLFIVQKREDIGSTISSIGAYGLDFLTLFRVAVYSTQIIHWSMPAVLALCIYGWRYCDLQKPVKMCLTITVLLAFGFYIYYQFDQGHGWGNRRIHPFQIVFIVFAAIGSSVLIDKIPRSAASLTALLVASTIFVLPYRLAQTKSVVAELSAPYFAAKKKNGLIFVRTVPGWYVQDTIRNDPFFDIDRVVLVSRGYHVDSSIMKRAPHMQHWLVRYSVEDKQVVVEPYTTKR